MYNIFKVSNKVTVVIPVYNESRTIYDILCKVELHCDEIVVVNDCSTDNSLNLINSFAESSKTPTKVLNNNKNLGIGKSMKLGFAEALKNKAKIIIKFDADGQHDPADIPSFTNLIIDKDYDLVKGNRFFKHESIKNMPIIKVIGNLITTNFQKVVSGNYRISDPNNGFLAIKADKLKMIDFNHLNNQYFFENSLVIIFSAYEFKIGEYGIKTIYGEEESSIPILRASLKLIPVFILFLYRRNKIKAVNQLSLNSLIFIMGNLVFFINLILKINILWILLIFLIVVYLLIDIMNFYLYD